MINYKVLLSDRDIVEFSKYLYNNDIKTIAIDFESENNLHEYGSKICLIQIYDGKNYYVIDPFMISKEQLKIFLEDKKIVKLGYGSESDMSLLFKQYQIRIKALYDLKLMVDVLEIEKKGLGDVNRLLLGIESEGNKKKYQMHNWTRRPIDKQAIEYALSDVAYLFSLRTILLDKILSQGLIGLLLEQFVKREYDYEKIPIPTIFKSREFGDLKKDEKERAKLIYEIREKYAKEQNCPANDIMLNKDLLYIARDKAVITSIVPGRKIEHNKFNKMIDEISKVFEEKTT
ncbi:MAG: ribonuclease D [Spirochaetales bacterium]